MGHVSRWRLYVDEAGSFAEREDDVVVAGLLMADAAATNPATLRAALDRAIPDLPWPLHAQIINLPVVFLLLQSIRAERHVEAEPATETAKQLDRLAAEGVARLGRELPAPTREALQELREGRTPAWSVLSSLNDALRGGHLRAYRRFDAATRAARATVFRILGALARRGDEAAAPPVAVIASGEGRVCDGAPDGSPGFDHGTARYLAVLESLLERVRDLLCLRGEGHEVRLKILSRPVWDSTRRRTVPLQRAHLDSILQRQSAGRGLRFVLDGVPQYDEGVEVQLVLVDFVANRTRFGLDHPDLGLRDTENRLRSLLSTPVRSGTPPLSHLAATGEARALVRRARGGDFSLSFSSRPGLRRWAREQALEWIQHFRGVT